MEADDEVKTNQGADAAAEPEADAAAGEDGAEDGGADDEAEEKDEAGVAGGGAAGGEGGGGGRAGDSNGYRKKKVALLFGYVGKGYAGMQRNPGVWTIEDELEKGLSKAGVIAPEDVGNFQKARGRLPGRLRRGGADSGGSTIAPGRRLTGSGRRERTRA